MIKMDSYRSSLLSLNRELENSDLESMKFACKDRIGAGVLEKITSGLQFFSELEKQTLLGPDKKDFLAKLFENVGRHDLKNKLLGIKETEPNTRPSVPNAPVVTGTLCETHLNDISEDLGRDWKPLGRKLGLSSNILENINDDYRKVREKAFQVLLRWKRLNGTAATGQVLADKLTLIGRKDIAEELAKHCKRDCGNVAVQAQNLPIPAEGGENQGPLETLADKLSRNLPTQDLDNSAVGRDEKEKLPVQEDAHVKNSKPDSVSETVETDSPIQAASSNNEVPPAQETKPPLVPNLGGILDPDRYYVIKQIGCGSCGKVYLCETKDQKHKYAVKQVDLGMNDSETQKQVKLLKKEIEFLKKLRHKHIVTLYHSEDAVKTVSIFMEYLPGGSISKYVKDNGKMEEQLVRKYTCQILKGCEYLHEQKVIHRDIKGANVLIDAHGNAKLADFGIAKDLENIITSTGSTTQGLCGTIYWCSPEHVNDDTPSYVFDVWSVGCTVVEMLTTKPPNRELNFAAALKRITQRDMQPCEDLPALAKAFVELCFKEKEERPTAKELLKSEFPSENCTNNEET